MVKPLKRTRVTQPVTSRPSPVVQSAQAGDSVLKRVHEMQVGLRTPNQGQFLDLTMADPDRYLDSLNLVVDTKRRFAALPARLRAECLNDPRQLLVLLQNASKGDSDSIHVLKRYGVIPKEPKATVTPVKTEQVDLVKESENGSP